MKVTMLAQKVEIVFTSSGHYAVPIGKTNQLVEHLHRNNQASYVYSTINEFLKKPHDQKLK